MTDKESIRSGENSSRYIVGIDLGTTNSVVAYLDALDAEPSEIKIFRIPQLTDSGVVDKRDILPSFLYMKDEGESSSVSFQLPWSNEADSYIGEAASESSLLNNIAVGEFARERGTEIPQKLVSSSKSWLCNQSVDRESAILPWETSGKEIRKISPVEAACAILSHIRAAWNYELAQGDGDSELQNQLIYLTVPASFDAVARELTVKASNMAGFRNIVLLEEPQSAFYSWIDKSGDKWREMVKKGDLILVCDIGGGTSDFSLIEVKEGDKGLLELERVAVGDHLLVGGDNIDFALSYYLAAKLREKKQKLDSWQMRSLVHSCRKAKETLLGGSSQSKEYQVTILGRGSGLIKGTIKQSLNITDIEKIVLDGFFPVCDLHDKPLSSSSAGIREFGLSYESDPAITRHLAKFLSALSNNMDGPMLPTAVVFNGGVMKSIIMRDRVMTVLRDWHERYGVKPEYGSGGIREIEAVDFDLSVARGAVYYGLAVRGDGIKIRGGLGKSYYMAIEASMPAVPGIPMPTRALCIAPFGMEEGSQAECRDRLFNLVVGEPVKFDIMTSSTRHNDIVGDVFENWEDLDVTELTSIETRLEGNGETYIPVTFEVKVTEVGTLEFWACSRDDDRKWRLELNVRPKE